MGKKLTFNMTGQYILWAEIPESDKSSFNRAFGPFKDRAAAYRGKASLLREFKKSMTEEWYTETEVTKRIQGIKWTTTKLWSPRGIR